MSYSNLHLSLGRCYSNNHKSHWKVNDGYTNNKVLNGYIKATNKPPNTRNKIHNSKHIELHYYSLRDIENSIDLIIKESLSYRMQTVIIPTVVKKYSEGIKGQLTSTGITGSSYSWQTFNP